MTNDDVDGGPATSSRLDRSRLERSRLDRSRLERSRHDRVLGGVCAGIAHSLGLDSLVLRIAAVVLVLVSGGTAILAYLVAWIIIPPAAGDQVRPARPRPAAENGGARVAWTAAGSDLRSLAVELRAARPEQARPEARPQVGVEQQRRTRAAAVDAAMTKLGDRLRDPNVRAGAQRAAVGVSTAVGASVEELGRRARRNPPTTGAGPAS